MSSQNRMIKNLTSKVHGIAVDLRNYFFDVGLFDTLKIPQKVVSVGNLTFGGTGKTPFVKYLMEYYSKNGLSVCVLMRGYKGKVRKPHKVNTHQHTQALSIYGDEALMLAEMYPKIPIYVGPYKYETAFHLSQVEKFDVLIIDDGFQHRSLQRDLNILLIDATADINDFELFPLGKARDRWSSKSRADLVFLTKTNLCDELWLDHLKELLGELSYSEARLILKGLEFDDHGKKAIAFAGIGNPESFKQAITNEGLIDLLDFIPFPDHHAYTQQEVNHLMQKKEELQADLILTTTKDAVKLTNFKKEDYLRVLDSEFVMALSEEELKLRLIQPLNLT